MAPYPLNDASPLLGVSGTRVRRFLSLKTRTSCSRWFRPLSLVTVEPALFLLLLGYGIEQIFKTNMFVDKTCAIQLHYSSDVCNNLDSGNYKAEQDATQKLTANYNLYCQLIELLPGALATLLLGALSDTRGRRLPLLITLAGAALKALLLCCNAYWWYLHPGYVLLSYIPSGLSGGKMASYMAAYAYLSASSSSRGRTTRLSIAGMTLYVGLSLGNVLGSAVFPHGGYVAVFGMQFIACFLALAYSWIRLPSSTPEVAAAMTEQRRMSPLSQLRRSLAVVARQRPGGIRACILGHALCISLYMISFGSNDFMFLYTRKMFMWNYKKYSAWSVMNSILTSLAACLFLPLLSLGLGVEDSLLAFSGSASHAFFDVLVGTAPEAFVLYIAAVLSAVGGITISCSRGALSKLVPPNELGAVFSMVGMWESLAPALAAPLYTLTYKNTLDIYPGTVFLISAALSLIICCIYTWLLTAFPAPASVVDPSQDIANHPLTEAPLTTAENKPL